MAKKVIKGKKEYRAIKSKKLGMAQMFDDNNSSVIPYTILELTNKAESDLFVNFTQNEKVKITGYTKGRGFAGTMKKWNFHGGPATHGQKDTHRSPGSIGAQGVGKVLPGKKMAGRFGNDTVTFVTKFILIDQAKGQVYVKGGVPGSRSSEVIIYVDK